jgi:hypothetical protein
MGNEDDKSTSSSYIQVTEQKRLNEAREKGVPWKNGGHTSASGNGGLSVKTTAEMAMLGTTSCMISPDPTLWFRNTWSWGDDETKPVLGQIAEDKIHASHTKLGDYTLQCERAKELLFTENESNAYRLWGQANPLPYVKDSFHQYLISGPSDAVNPAKTGTKAAAHYLLDLPPGGSKVVRLRLTPKTSADGFGKFHQVLDSRLAEANEFYDRITPTNLSEDERRVHRQALAGMLWSKQYYDFDLDRWLTEHDSHPMVGSGKGGARNADWFHMLNSDVISIPDKWEYPWYAAWDLAFHPLALSLVDFDFAKDQLLLMLRNLYAHPNRQIPAYEWNFGDVNPRCMPGQRYSFTEWRQNWAARTSASWNVPSGD